MSENFITFQQRHIPKLINKSDTAELLLIYDYSEDAYLVSIKIQPKSKPLHIHTQRGYIKSFKDPTKGIKWGENFNFKRVSILYDYKKT